MKQIAKSLPSYSTFIFSGVPNVQLWTLCHFFYSQTGMKHNAEITAIREGHDFSWNFQLHVFPWLDHFIYLNISFFICKEIWAEIISCPAVFWGQNTGEKREWGRMGKMLSDLFQWQCASLMYMNCSCRIWLEALYTHIYTHTWYVYRHTHIYTHDDTQRSLFLSDSLISVIFLLISLFTVVFKVLIK